MQALLGVCCWPLSYQEETIQANTYSSLSFGLSLVYLAAVDSVLQAVGRVVGIMLSRCTDEDSFERSRELLTAQPSLVL